MILRINRATVAAATVLCVFLISVTVMLSYTAGLNRSGHDTEIAVQALTECVAAISRADSAISDVTVWLLGVSKRTGQIGTPDPLIIDP
jgi:hypothetical protein